MNNESSTTKIVTKYYFIKVDRVHWRFTSSERARCFFYKKQFWFKQTIQGNYRVVNLHKIIMPNPITKKLFSLVDHDLYDGIEELEVEFFF